MSSIVPSASAGEGATAGGVFDSALQGRIARARNYAVAALLAERTPEDHWEGELSSSALSTATAVTALTLVGRGDPASAERNHSIVSRGFDWLIAHQNPDGGWGDTVVSKSNISTTTLGWAALALAPPNHPGVAAAEARVERWLAAAAGSLGPAELVWAIEARYGKDRTFSIPILTMCALCGRLGVGEDGWARVRQLPFEVAALPQRWFGALQLPVVSYALPALIAIGQVRHTLRPTRNPLARWLRNLFRERTLRTLTALQPTNGGFLEATPLTSFVTMSLAGAGRADHEVVRRGVEFLTAAVRPDGSWPIDTNLATWVTTLALEGIGAERAGSEQGAGGVATPTLLDWLLRQQYRVEHPYTLAAPGGWAWTNLPGAVPDADDTPGALLALRRFGNTSAEVRAAAAAGVGWLLDLQNRDGGIPTFCRGWGRLPFDRSSPDLTAHAIRAWTAWRDDLDAPLRVRVDRGLARAVGFLGKTQRSNGAWVPLWFGHQDAPDDENPLYGTARVIPALCDLAATDRGAAIMIERALGWLVSRQHADGGWSAAAASSVEETGLAVEALAVAWARGVVDEDRREAVRAALRGGGEWLAAAVESGRWRAPSPIGFYFAKLWYFERLYPMIFATGALVRLGRLAS